MAARLKRPYESWEDNPDIGFVLMKGSGRAFCSGADAVSLYQLVNEGDVDEYKKFFETLYKFVYIQGTYLKPHVAIMDGITMGAGAGIAIPGMFRVVTDKTGVRARLVGKDFAPKVPSLLPVGENYNLFEILQWNPPSFKDVSKDMVDYYFLPLPEVEPELKLPTAMREPFMQETDSPKK
ncbi:small ribosomal subunit protein mS47-like [Pyrus communis]|uniref:small ribosomal subunit protein mS47-like n=1 Tax=Pyrus communis TaxID=23211 RepID=UPI0035BF6705